MKTFNIFQLQRWSIHDGDGIRSTVFFKGCPLRCKWCANPESWYQKLEIMVYQKKCTNCKRCLAVCAHGAITQSASGKLQFDRDKCAYCQKCIAVCVPRARKQIGETVTLEGVMQMIRKDCIFYQESGGGVTFSGGEPFMQSSYLRQLVLQCQAMGIDTAVETSAYFDFAENQDIIANLDAMFIDIKHMDDEIHHAYTGVHNQKILENIIKISKIHQNITIRVPLIAEVNASEKNIRAMCEFLKNETTIKQIELLPYHMLGEHKMEALGIVVKEYTTPTEEEIKNLEQMIEAYDLSVVKF
ncbi:MAG: cutD 2 [Firmicutes bacterium]|nr:cutD 2 [Bacillota bacterium]